MNLTGTVARGEIGKHFDITLQQTDGSAFDLSTASTIGYLWRKPDGTTAGTVGVASGASSLGIARYTTVSGDLSQKGDWKVQVRVTTSTGGDFRSEVLKFTVIAGFST